MLCSVVLKIPPQVIRQRVLGIHNGSATLPDGVGCFWHLIVTMQDVSKSRWLRRLVQSVQIDRNRLTESYEIDSLTLLRHPGARINDACGDVISQLGQRARDHF